MLRVIIVCLSEQQRDIIGAYRSFSRMLLPDRGRQIVSERVPELSGESKTLSGTQLTPSCLLTKSS